MSQQQFSSNQHTSKQTEQVEATSVEYEGLDSILDEIDEVLETNAESFVAGFVQKGGQ